MSGAGVPPRSDVPRNIEATPRHPWTRAEKLAATVGCLALLASLAVTVHPWYDPMPDASVYIASSRALASGDGYTYLGEPIRVRPPGLAPLISPFVRGHPIDFARLNTAVSLFGVLSVVLLYVFLRRRVPWPLALLSGAALWVNPFFQRFCNRPMSDVPGLALLMVGLLVARWANHRPALSREVLLGISIGLAGYVRVGNLLLVPAVAVARLLHTDAAPREPARWGRFLTQRVLVFALAALLVQAPWALRNQRVTAGAEAPADQVLPYSYLTGFLHEDKNDPASRRLTVSEILARVPRQGGGILAGLGSRLEREQARAGDTALALVLLAGLALTLVRRRATAEIFATGTLLVVASYFGYQNRLLLPAYVMAFAATVDALHASLRRLRGGPSALWATAGILLVVIAADASFRREWPAIEARHRRFVRLTRTLAEQLPPGSCLASAWGYDYSVFLDRPVYSLEPSVRRGGLPEVEATLDRLGIDLVLLSPASPAEARLLPYFEASYGAAQHARGARIFRVRPANRACRTRLGDGAR